MRRVFPLVLCAVSVWCAAALPLREVELAVYDPSPTSNFRLAVPMMPPSHATASHIRRPFTLHDRDVIKQNDRDVAARYRDLIKRYRDVIKRGRDLSVKHDRDVPTHDIDIRNDRTHDYSVKLHDLENRWIKVNPFGPADRYDKLLDRDNRDVKLHDNETNLRGRENLDVGLYDHNVKLHDRNSRGTDDINLHDHEFKLVEHEPPLYRVYSGPAGKGEINYGPFSDIPSGVFTRDSTEHRPSVKKELSAGGPWLDAVCQSMELDDRERFTYTVDGNPRQHAPCGLCCALHCQIAGPPAPELAELARPASELTPAGAASEELLTVLVQVLAARRNWHVLNSNHPDLMKQYVLINNDGTLVV